MGIIDSYADMAKRLGISKTETIRRLKTLEKMGYVTLIKQKDGKNEIFVHFFPKSEAV